MTQSTKKKMNLKKASVISNVQSNCQRFLFPLFQLLLAFERMACDTYSNRQWQTLTYITLSTPFY